MQQELPELGDYLLALKRRRVWAGAAAAVVVLVSLYLAYGVPPTYRANATILIEQQDIPQDLVRTTVTGYADERIQSISQRVMTRDNLVSIAERHDLFPDIRASGSEGTLLSSMREAIFFEQVQANILDESRGRTYPVTIAFSVAFEYSVPELAQAVANELSELFLLENTRTRTELAGETLTFLEQEALALREETADLEQKMAAFKEANQHTMPELSGLNMDLIRRTEAELERVRQEIRNLEYQRNLLAVELRSTSRTTPVFSESGEVILTGEDRLRSLQSEFLRLSAIYSPDHPDLQRIQREIRALDGSAGGSGSSTALLTEELAAREAELEDARRRYSDSHPDVRRLTAVVADLRAQIADGAGRPRPAPQAPNNPAYIQLQVQIDSNNRQILESQARVQRLEQELQDYTARVARTPETEREWLSLARDHNLAVNKYQQVRTQIVEAQRGVALETAQKGERLTLIDPARLPQEPIRPNPPIILLVGFMFALGAAAGLVAMLETLDSTVRGAKDVRALLELPALASIPYVANASDRQAMFMRSAAVWTLFGGALVAAVLIVL
jgi:polysaccharide biosynthesis transport protein